MTRIRTVKGIAGFTTVAASAVAIAFLVGLVGLAAPVSSHHPAAPASTALLGAPAISFGTASKPSVTYELPTPNPQENGGYGGALAISGTVAVVGTSAESSSGFSNAGVAYIVNLATGKTIQLTSPDPQVNGYFGYSVAINGSTVAVGAPGQAVGDLSAAGEAYTFNAESGALILGFSSPLAATGGGFGHSVALSSKLFVVGAPGEGGSGEYMDSGHVYAFSTSTGDLKLNLTSPNKQKVGGFGISVATTSTTLVVGAEGETAAGLLEAGHAYLLRASNGSVIATLTSPNPVTDGFFGISVAVSGSRVIVGAPYETGDGLANAGHAYTFSASTGALLATLTSPNAQTGGIFGYDVAISGSTAVVGAFFESGAGVTDAGRAYSLSATTGAVSQTFTSPNPQVEGFFGFAVASSGTTILASAPNETASGLANAGHVYYFGDGPLGLTNPVPLDSTYFGYSVALSGTTLVVGTPGEDVDGVDGGAVYLINLETGAMKTLTSPNEQSDGYFGESVAVSGTTLVVGAGGETVSTFSEAGHAYVYSMTTGSLLATLVSANPQTDGYFGFSVGVSGTTAIVGAPDETSSEVSEAGNAYVFDAKSGDLISTVSSPSPYYGGSFGWSVAVSGSTVAAGAPLQPGGGLLEAGNAYTFSATTGDLEHSFTSPNAVEYGYFGSSVALSSTSIVIGGESETAGGETYAGHVYLYSASTDDLALTLSSPTPAYDGYFGERVALSGTTLVVGGGFATAGGFEEAGQVFSFKSTTGALLHSYVSPSPQTAGQFGWSVAASGSEIAIGAPDETANGDSYGGYVYLY